MNGFDESLHKNIATNLFFSGRGVLARRRICENKMVDMVLVGTSRGRLLQGNLESGPALFVKTSLLTWVLVGTCRGRLLQGNCESWPAPSVRTRLLIWGLVGKSRGRHIQRKLRELAGAICENKIVNMGFGR
jgi:hypothetical protein